MRFLRSWLVGFALVFVLVGAALWIWSFRTYGAHDWQPLRVPVALEAGAAASGNFDTDMDGTYWVMLQIQSDLPWEEQKRILGKSSFVGEGDAEPILVPWEVSSQGEVVATGDGRSNTGSGRGGAGRVSVGLGSLEGKADGHYSIKAVVRKSVPELSGAAVFLVVEPHPMLHKTASLNASVGMKHSHLALGLAAVLLAVRVALLLARRWRSTRSSASAAGRHTA